MSVQGRSSRVKVRLLVILLLFSHANCLFLVSVSKGGQADQKVALVQEERNHKPVEQEVAWQNVFRWEFKFSW